MWRTVIVNRGEKLSISNNWLVVYSGDIEQRIPVEDIYSLIIDNPGAMLSVDVLSTLSIAGAHIIYCDKNHLPCAVTYTLNSYYKPLTAIENQMSLSKETKDSLWDIIVKQKIINQSLCLKYCGLKNDSFKQIELLSKEIHSGDTTNREAVAAKKYFKYLFGATFKRTQDDITNAALNYGYSIMRSAVAKSLAVHGYLGQLGIHHINKGNPFNLADDLMEPLRPLVDMWVDTNCDELYGNLSKENKKSLISLINFPVLFDGKKMRIRYAIDLYIKSLTSAIVSKNSCLLKVPILLPLDTFFEDEQDG